MRARGCDKHCGNSVNYRVSTYRRHWAVLQVRLALTSLGWTLVKIQVLQVELYALQLSFMLQLCNGAGEFVSLL